MSHIWSPCGTDREARTKSDKEMSGAKMKKGNEGNQSAAYLHSHGHLARPRLPASRFPCLPPLPLPQFPLHRLFGLCSLRLIQFVNSPFDKVNLSLRLRQRCAAQGHKSCLMNIGQMFGWELSSLQMSAFVGIRSLFDCSNQISQGGPIRLWKHNSDKRRTAQTTTMGAASRPELVQRLQAAATAPRRHPTLSNRGKSHP